MGKVSQRVTDVILLCEDKQHEAFARRFFQEMGINKRRIRVVSAPRGLGSAEQWIRDNYPKQVKALRENRHIQGVRLIVVVDEDTSHTKSRAMSLRESLTNADLEPRAEDERVIHAIPARNIETWIAYLQGGDVNETDSYPKLARERECSEAVTELYIMCKNRELRRPFPDSLARACEEFRARWD